MTVDGRSTSQPSAERPDRRSRNAVTRTPRTASSTPNAASAFASAACACRRTSATSASGSAIGPMVSKLKRRFSAADISDTPRSRRLAVAMTVKPGAA